MGQPSWGCISVNQHTSNIHALLAAKHCRSFKSDTNSSDHHNENRIEDAASSTGKGCGNTAVLSSPSGRMGRLKIWPLLQPPAVNPNPGCTPGLTILCHATKCRWLPAAIASWTPWFAESGS